MNRRDFFLLAPGLLVPAPTYFFAPTGGWLRKPRIHNYDLGSVVMMIAGERIEVGDLVCIESGSRVQLARRSVL